MAAISGITFVVALVLYATASALFFGAVAQPRANNSTTGSPIPSPMAVYARRAPLLLGLAAIMHSVYVGIASLVARVCPIHSVHFFLSVASLFAIAGYLTLRRRFRIEALGVLVGPLGLALLLGTYFLGRPGGPEPRFSALFIALHVVANLMGIALFWLAGGAAGLYLMQEKRLKQKRIAKSTLPPLDALDRAIHRFLIAGFPLLTLGIITGTYWAQKLETGSADEVMRTVIGFLMWLLIAAVLLLRVTAGWRGRRAAYGAIAGLVCSAAVLSIYLFRPAASAAGLGG